MTVSAFSYFQHLCSVSVLFPCFYPNQVLPTFHCKVKELLVLCEGFGGKGHSGAEPWVVKLTGSEQDPFTELYIAYTLETVFKWVINVLRVTVALPQPQYLSTKAPQIPPINDRLFTDYPYFTSFIQECKKNHSRRGTVFCANIPTDYWVILIIFSSHQYFLAYCQASAHCGKILLEIQQKKVLMPGLHLIHMYHVECRCLLVSFHGYNLLLLRHRHLVDLHGLELTQVSNTDKLKIFKTHLISGKSSIWQHSTK